MSFGWHVGYYAFVVVTASKETSTKLDTQTRQVISLIQPTLVELSKYFGIDAEFKVPPSPQEARRLRLNLEKLHQASSGISLPEKLRIDFGQRVSSFYELGSKIINYALMHRRTEPEIKAVTSSLRRDIDRLSTILNIGTSHIEEILSSDEFMLSTSTLEERLIPEEQPPEWYVSYAWGDDRTPEGRAREEIVDRLCEAAKAQGYSILRDKHVMNLGDSISAFMRRIGTGDRVFVLLSDKYLRSPHCMFELSEVWRTSRQEGGAFLERVRIYALPDANISTPTDWADWAIHWKKEHSALESRALQHGPVVLGELGNRRLMQMRIFYTQVTDILGTLADIVQPRTFEELERYGFNDPPV
jgi:hypothetical protein